MGEIIKKLTGAVLSCVVLCGVFTPTSAHATPFAEDQTKQGQIPSPTDPRDEFIFDHAVSLADAEAIADEQGFSNVTYRHENKYIVGEYSPRSDYGPGAFAETFYDEYGTEAQIVSIKAETGTDRVLRLHLGEIRRNIDHVPFTTGKPEFIAPPVPGRVLAKKLNNDIEVERSAMPEQFGSAASDGWRPEGMGGRVVKRDGYMEIKNFMYAYDQNGERPYNLPPYHGIEIETNLYQGGDPGFRPFCVSDNYKDRFIAKNYGWSWALFTKNAESVGAYADYNDLSDECSRNSMAIGIQFPQSLGDEYGNVYAEAAINAPTGLSTSDVVGGVVQVVNGEPCMSAGYLPAATDCMGLIAPEMEGPLSRTFLGIDRGWRAPDLCWESDGYGIAQAPIQGAC